ncbi:YihY/virulence factor BrkB family protein [Actinomycetospora sp. TBRC 11914]|uniref:YihY/virulence factor BrkB family protein n=1 Tax=Actinomycetospora sp. TBRC 11914 TaxID=2729387 RepID=UPI00145D5D42|nr:YihY/virulence factor BrkB family protein [Actinomycetospora sp. TBRC 11914]NMO89088.1 YihY/virulence factor BrkB family protein [Actinomycetospora sp. TBRC 11914]
MSSVRAVPETTDMHGEDLSADDAWHTARRAGLRELGRTAFLRFRYGDGFSHARAFAFQLALATVPLIIAGSGLASAVGAESVAQVVARTVVAVSPGTGDQLLAAVVDRGSAPAPAPGEDPERPGEDLGELAVVLGLVTAFVAMTSAFAQLERGANRVYGVERDRPALRKYGRAAVLTATAGTALGVGLVLIVAGGAFGDALEEVYRWGDAAETVWDVVRWPVGLAALVVAVTTLFRFAPRRRQPGLSWLGLGAALTVAAWLAASGAIAAYVSVSGEFSAIYGPLAGIMVLLLWALATGVALVAGFAVSAQLEAVRAGVVEPLLTDRDDDGVPDHLQPTEQHSAGG